MRTFVAVQTWRSAACGEKIDSARLRVAVVHQVCSESSARSVPQARNPRFRKLKPDGEMPMSAVLHSRQAQAAKRFVEATRNVDQAFRAVRRDPEDGVSADEHAAAVAQLDRALDELARAQALFDSVVRIDARRRN
jgi:hypothetical protein